MSKAKAPTYTEEDLAQLDPALVEACAEDRFVAVKTFLKVANKQGALVPCVLADDFRQHWEASGEISIWLKDRQRYLTTSCDAMLYMDIAELEGVKALCLNLNEDKAQENFQRVRAFDQNRHPVLKELSYSVDSSDELGYKETRGVIKSVTIKNDSTEAQAELVARSGTYHRVRWTEAAFSRHYKTVKRALLDTMPKDNRKLVIESTGNGAQGGFYDDFMEVVTHGEPVPGLPGAWRLGNVTAHFLPWFTFWEKKLPAPTFSLSSLAPDVQHQLEQDEQEHLEAMRAYGLTDEAIQQALNWRREVLVTDKNLRTDPAGAIKNMNREHPATYRHAFQSSGQAWFSLTQIDRDREFWRAKNTEDGTPVYIGLRHVRGAIPEEIQGRDFQIYDLPIRGHRHRYCAALDPSGGHEDGDKTALLVLDRARMKIVAAAHGAYTPRRAALMLMALGAYYDWALINWENDGLGLGCSEVIDEEGYPNIYRCEPDRVDLGGMGWNTGPASREELVARLKTHYEHPYNGLKVPFLPWYDEAAAFQCPPGKRKPVATTGNHDDLVMASGVLIMTHLSMPAYAPPSREPKMQPGQVSTMAVSGAVTSYRDRVKSLRNY